MKTKNKAAVSLGKKSASKQKQTLGIRKYKAQMSKRGKSGANKRWEAYRKNLSTNSIVVE